MMSMVSLFNSPGSLSDRLRHLTAQSRAGMPGYSGQQGQGVSGLQGGPVAGRPRNVVPVSAEAPPQATAARIPRYHNVQAPAARTYRVRSTNVQAPQFGHVRDAQFDPYQAQGVGAVDRIEGQDHQVGDAPSFRWQGVYGQEAGQSGIQQELQQQAMDDLRLGGQLSGEDTRMATQSARTAFADRGMGRSNPAMFAEALNRDVLSRQRQGERRQFAAGVDEQDFAQRAFDAQQRQQAQVVDSQGRMQTDATNAGMQMQGLLANQDAGLRSALANQATGLQQHMFNADAANQAGQFNAQGGLQAALANQGVDLARGQTMYQGQLQAGMANQQARLQAAMANQGNAQATGLANQAAQLQAQMANQGTDLAVSQANQRAAMQAGLANQGMAGQFGLANQQAAMQAQGANQQASLGVYGIDRNIANQQQMWRQNAGENRAINNANMAALQQLMQMYQ